MVGRRGACRPARPQPQGQLRPVARTRRSRAPERRPAPRPESAPAAICWSRRC